MCLDRKEEKGNVIFSRLGVVTAKGVTRFGAKQKYPDGRLIHWMVEAPKDLGIKERLQAKRACEKCVQDSSSKEEVLECLQNNAPDGAKFVLFVEEPQGLYWAATPSTTLVVANKGRLCLEGNDVVCSDGLETAVVALFGDFEKYESKALSTWAKKQSKNTSAALSEIFPENTCSLASKLNGANLNDGAFLWVSKKEWK